MIQKCSFAFQPIVDITNNSVFSYEALLRGLNNEPASIILNTVNKDELEAFDQRARNRAIELASELKLQTCLNLNFLSQSLEHTNEYVLQTSQKFQNMGFEITKLIIEITEENIINDLKVFKDHINKFRALGIQVAFDDFGAGYSNLNWLAEFQPDIIKLDINLIKNIHNNGPKQAIVRGIKQTCFSLGIEIIAEGVELVEEYLWLKKQNINLMQGYLFARPAFEALPTIHFIDE